MLSFLDLRGNAVEHAESEIFYFFQNRRADHF